MSSLGVVTIILLMASLIAGRFAIFTNGGNGNGGWYLIFWALTVVTAITSTLLASRMMRANSRVTVTFTAVVATILFIFSNPIAFFTIFAFPVLLAFYIYVMTILAFSFIRPGRD